MTNSCRQAFEIDLADFLGEPRAERFAAFRDHYPRCASCAAEVRAWTELDLQLRATASGSDHPGPDLLARYQADPSAVQITERRELEDHVATCRTCRDELRALATVDPTRLAVPAGIGGSGTEPPTAGPFGRAWVAVRHLLWHPAFAYALLAITLGPAIYETLSQEGLRPPPRRTAMWKPEETSARERAVSGPRAAEGLSQPSASPEGVAPRAEGVSEVSKPRDMPGRTARRNPERKRVPSSPTFAAHSTAAASESRVAQASEGRADVGVSGEAVAKKAGVVASEEVGVFGKPAPGRVLRLEPSSERIRIASTDEPVVLRAPLPDALRDAHEIEVRVASASGRRELVDRRQPEDPLEIRIPPGWFEPGDHLVTFSLRGASPVARYRIRMVGPTANPGDASP